MGPREAGRKSSKQAPVIFAVGHGTRLIGDFLAILESVRVQRYRQSRP